MRALAALSISALVACHPSATVERTMPIASLQAYRTIAVRVRTTQYAWPALAGYLEGDLAQRLQQMCSFDHVVRGAAAADVVVDLNITNTARGGTGVIRNQSLATVDTLLVLSDGENRELLGSARIHGRSSGVQINQSFPENEAVDAVAHSVADLLVRSGCAGPRVARAETPAAAEPTPTTQTATPTPATTPTIQPTSTPTTPEPTRGSASPAPVPDESHRAEAEALNDSGKEKFLNNDLPGAIALFQQANALLPDPRYEFNLCLAFGVQEQWDQATAACKQARTMNPQPKLAAKIDRRLEQLAQHQ